jgi:hypothetical protein
VNLSTHRPEGGACSRFTLSRAFYPVFEDGTSRGRTGERFRIFLSSEIHLWREMKKKFLIFTTISKKFKLVPKEEREEFL